MPAPRYSYQHNYRISAKAKRVKKVKHILFNKFTFFIVFLIGLFGYLFYFVFFGQYFSLTRVEVTGNSKINSDEIKDLIYKNIPQKILSFDSRSYFATDLKKIESKAREDFLLISSIKISKKLPDKIFVVIEERKPDITICKETNCFNFDSLGVAFESGQASIPIIQTLNDISLGFKFDEKTFNILKNLTTKLKNIPEIPIKEILLLQNEGKIIATTSDGCKILFSTENSIIRQVENLKFTIDQKISPVKLKKMDYIDLRFGDNVYFLIKGVASNGDGALSNPTPTSASQEKITN